MKTIKLLLIASILVISCTLGCKKKDTKPLPNSTTTGTTGTAVKTYSTYITFKGEQLCGNNLSILTSGTVTLYNDQASLEANTAIVTRDIAKSGPVYVPVRDTATPFLKPYTVRYIGMMDIGSCNGKYDTTITSLIVTKDKPITVVLRLVK